MNASDLATLARAQRSHEGNPTPPAHLAAVWGAFLQEGLMLHSRNTERSAKILETWSNGSIELIIAVCEFIPAIWRQVQPYWYGPQGFPGVFEYEVISILGEQLSTHVLQHEGNLPTDAEVERMAAELIVTFFSLGGATESHPDQEGLTDRLITLHERFIERLAHLPGGDV